MWLLKVVALKYFVWPIEDMTVRNLEFIKGVTLCKSDINN